MKETCSAADPTRSDRRVAQNALGSSWMTMKCAYVADNGTNNFAVRLVAPFVQLAWHRFHGLSGTLSCIAAARHDNHAQPRTNLTTAAQYHHATICVDVRPPMRQTALRYGSPARVGCKARCADHARVVATFASGVLFRLCPRVQVFMRHLIR